MVFSFARGEYHRRRRCRGFPRVMEGTYAEKICIIIIIRHNKSLHLCRPHDSIIIRHLFLLRYCARRGTRGANARLRSPGNHLSRPYKKISHRRRRRRRWRAHPEYRTHADFVIFAMSLFTNRYNETWQNGVLCTDTPPRRPRGPRTRQWTSSATVPSAGQQVYNIVHIVPR